MADQESELYEVERLGATPVKNSGRGFYKGDAILRTDEDDSETGFFTVDVKEYEKSFGVSINTWTKLQTDAKFNKTNPMFKIVLGTDEKTRIRIIALSEAVFLDMWEVYKKHGG